MSETSAPADAVAEASSAPIFAAERELLLQLDGVRAGGLGEGDVRLHDVNFRLHRGELAMLQLDSPASVRGVASLLQGLRVPEAGTLTYLGETWTQRRYADQDQLRFRIGRIFVMGAWIESLTIRDNLRLAPTHHGHSIAAVDQRVDELIEAFPPDMHLGGTKPIRTRLRDHLQQRPSYVAATLRQLFQWLRAALYPRDLWILERPDTHLGEAALSIVCEWMRESLEAGAAAIWMGPSLPATAPAAGQTIAIHRGLWKRSGSRERLR
ncbi:MAG: hypothetical protein AAF958_09835 [Planctomycetota bacterium]